MFWDWNQGHMLMIPSCTLGNIFLILFLQKPLFIAEASPQLAQNMPRTSIHHLQIIPRSIRNRPKTDPDRPKTMVFLEQPSYGPLRPLGG